MIFFFAPLSYKSFKNLLVTYIIQGCLPQGPKSQHFIIEEGSVPIILCLWEDRNLILVDTLLQIVKLPPVMKILEVYFFFV